LAGTAVFLKLTNGASGFRVIEITSCAFRRLPEPAVDFREIGTVEDVTYPLTGNAFLLNNDGNTIESFFLKR